MITQKCLSLTLFVLASASLSAQPIKFNVPPRDFAVGNAPTGVATGDFSGSGKLDVVSVNGVVSLLKGNGDGTFQNAVTISTVVALAITAADFNHDGKLDIALAGSDGVSVLLGNGDGTFGSPLFSFDGIQNSSIVVTDLNGDGKLDVVMSETFGSISTLLGNGDGTFSAFQMLPSSSAAGIVTGDFNHDGKPDVAACSNGSFSVFLNTGVGLLGSPRLTNTPFSCSSITAGHFHASRNEDIVIAFDQSTEAMVYPGNGDGTFGTPLTIDVPADFVTVRDMNEDGAADIVTMSSRNNIVTVLLGNGRGGFKKQPYAVVGGEPLAAAFGRFSGASKGPDMAIADSESSSVSILINQGNGTFLKPANYPVQGSAQSVATADFNHDGNLDLAVANSTDNSVSLLLGTAVGTFQAVTTFAVGKAPNVIAVGDFDHDGNPDVVTSNSGDGTLTVLLGLGNGSLGPPTTIPVATSSLVIGDFNGDGKLDIACTGGSSVVLLPGNGDGTFGTPQRTQTPFSPSLIVAADFNHDGVLDIAIADDKEILVLEGNRTGTFTGGFDYNTSNAVTALAVGDMNGDGNQDIIVGRVNEVGLVRQNETSNFDFVVLLGAGDGSFPVVLAQFVAVSGVPSVVTGDFSGDGKLDVAIADSGDDRVALFLGNGDGTLQSPVDFPALRFGRWLATGDFNHDDRLDIAIANDESVGVLLNTTK